MCDILLRLKGLLNSYTDEELRQLDLWVDNETTLQAFTVEDGSITLLTDLSKVKINEMEW